MSLDTAVQATNLLKMPGIMGDCEGRRVRAHAIVAAECPKWRLQQIDSEDDSCALATA